MGFIFEGMWGGGVEVFCQQLFLFSFEQGGPAIARTVKRAVCSDRPTENSAVSLCSTRLSSLSSDDCLGFMVPNKNSVWLRCRRSRQPAAVFCKSALIKPYFCVLCVLKVAQPQSYTNSSKGHKHFRYCSCN